MFARDVSSALHSTVSVLSIGRHRRPSPARRQRQMTDSKTRTRTYIVTYLWHNGQPCLVFTGYPQPIIIAGCRDEASSFAGDSSSARKAASLPVLAAILLANGKLQSARPLARSVGLRASIQSSPPFINLIIYSQVSK